jgi:hypothetical protein
MHHVDDAARAVAAATNLISGLKVRDELSQATT